MKMDMLLENCSSERLLFKKLTPDYATAWEKFLADKEATKYFPPFENVKEHSKFWIDRQLARYEKDKVGHAALHLKSTGEFIGMCGLLVQEVDGQSEFEIGYHLLPEFWKNGYATEAAIFCKRFAFENNLAPHLISLIDPDNIPSQKVASRNGMYLWKKSVHHGAPCLVFRVDK